jgi:hypothetical protein
MSSQSKGKSVPKSGKGPEPTMEELVRQVSGLMRAGVREDLRDRVQPEPVK